MIHFIPKKQDLWKVNAAEFRPKRSDVTVWQCLSDILKQKDAVLHKVDVTHGSTKVLKNVASLAADREWEDRLYRWLERTKMPTEYTSQNIRLF